MSSTQWETVGKSAKAKTKGSDSNKGKNKKKLTASNMPKIEPARKSLPEVQYYTNKPH